MRSTARLISSAVVGGLVLLWVSSVAAAQGAPRVHAVTHLASVAFGAIQGTVQDERGAPVAGATISALGASTALAVSDRAGRFEMRTLSPGPYLVRAHLAGFVASRGQMVDVRPNARASSAIALRHSTPSSTPAYPILAAGLGAAPESSSAPPEEVGTAGTTRSGDDDHGEIAWRLRHLRRGILKDATVPEEILVSDTPPDQAVFGPGNFLGRAVSSPARYTANFFAGTPFSGQVNLLTTGSFDTPQQLFTSDNFSRSTAYLALGAPVGDYADWTMRAALTQGDLTSWIIAGEYTTRAPARHRYDMGLSYSTQRYDGGNFAALRSVTDGSRNAGAMYAFDTFAVTPSITLTYGGRYARYDYLDERSLFSPRVALTLEPVEHFRISGILSRRALAPGAEEFMPRMDSGIWLPPQRTFSALTGRPLEAERTNHLELEVERDIASATVSLRAFRQQVSDQLVTLFGIDLPGSPAALGHYFLGNAGNMQASGLSAGARAAIAKRIHGSIEYSLTRAHFTSPEQAAYMLVFAPYASRAERIHDVAAAVETDVPETSTRVVVLYRVSNAFARPGAPEGQIGPPTVAQAAADRSPLDSRFDVQVRQSLPFMDFSTAKWEMLIGVRNFFRETAPDQSVYDELLVVHPPKRIVGGLTLKF
jgi:TonB-dependent receptor-like protein/carboxypeptidase family protein